MTALPTAQTHRNLRRCSNFRAARACSTKSTSPVWARSGPSLHIDPMSACRFDCTWASVASDHPCRFSLHMDDRFVVNQHRYGWGRALSRPAVWSGHAFGEPIVDATGLVFKQAKGRACRWIGKQAFQSQSLLALPQLLERGRGGVVFGQSQKITP